MAMLCLVASVAMILIPTFHSSPCVLSSSGLQNAVLDSNEQ